jgi:DnaK suppressor protein
VMGFAKPSRVRLTAEFRRQLLDAREALFRTIGATDEELTALMAREPGDPLEHAASTSAATLLSRLQGQEKHELDEIVDALARLEGGTYGLCERCRGPIPLERVRAMPAGRYCLDCQLGEERRR